MKTLAPCPPRNGGITNTGYLMGLALGIRMILFHASRLEFNLQIVLVSTDYALFGVNRKLGTKFVALEDVRGTIYVCSTYPRALVFFFYLCLPFSLNTILSF